MMFHAIIGDVMHEHVNKWKWSIMLICKASLVYQEPSGFHNSGINKCQ